MSQLKAIQDEEAPIWLPQLASNGGPRFLQIADALQAAVAGGSLKPGDRLPPQRRLAAQLDVDLTTITRAYAEARRRNLLEGRGARGTYVAAPKVDLTAILDLSMNTPPPPDGVDFDDMLKQGLSQVLMMADNELLMTYHRLRVDTRSARTRTFPGRAKIICADGRSPDGRTGHSVDPRRFG
jgi:DNA-binding transcriptional regulator YhcF (GntR family)